MRQSRGIVVTVLSLVLFGVLAHVASAQQQAQPQADDPKAQAMEDIQLTRAVISAERQAIISRAMDLTPQEMQGFWPLYREYRVEMGKVGDRIIALIANYADNQQNLTDAVADQLLTEFVNIEKEKARLKAKYLPKFKKVLPARKVARFYQLENKLDVAIQSEMAQTIPLVR